MAISSVNDSSRFQIIQSHTNRQRIDEQFIRSDEQEKSSANLEQKTSVVPKISSAAYEETYAKAQEEFLKDGNQGKFSSKANAYQMVQNQEKRDSVSDMLGISVYA